MVKHTLRRGERALSFLESLQIGSEKDTYSVNSSGLVAPDGTKGGLPCFSSDSGVLLGGQKRVVEIQRGLTDCRRRNGML